MRTKSTLVQKVIFLIIPLALGNQTCQLSVFALKFQILEKVQNERGDHIGFRILYKDSLYQDYSATCKKMFR